MNSSVARERFSSVLKPDSITTAQGDFLATHVAMNRLHLLEQFDFLPNGGKNYSEDEVYQRFVLNPENKHQFIVVYGVSGTGKSHLIRWFEAKYENDKPDNEVVLFVRRSDNTLKGTIRQLLALPEVQNIANKDIYQRLLRAVAYEDENKLKGRIYYDFINEVQNDNGDHDIELSNFKKKRLAAFMSDEVVKAHLMAPEGPIERIYSKIAENSLVDRDIIAQFEDRDFLVSTDLYDKISLSGAAQNAEKMARELMADESGLEEARIIASYLNQFVNDVIQRCAGIESGDFRDIFQEIRKELYRQGKNLTLFIEDITSFTGVDEALLDSIVVEHTGLNAKENLCRISSIVGTTNNYLQNNFKDNHKDRITQYIYIPSDVFDENEIFEFVGRYLNTMSLPEEVIEDWVKNHALASDYPIHETKEGENWEFIPIGYGKDLCLYPFTKNSICYLYKNELKKGHKTPRYIIKNIIEPVVNDILWNKENFPSIKYNIVGINTSLSIRIDSQIHDEDMKERLIRFLSIWGDGNPEQYTSQDGSVYISSIKKEIFKELGFPEINFAEVSPPKKEHNDKIISPKEKKKSSPNVTVSTKYMDSLKKTFNILNEWVNGCEIDISANVGPSGMLRAAQDDICSYLRSSINWQAEGISQDNVNKIKNSNVRLITFENQRKIKFKGVYELPANRSSVNVISAFIKWREYGNRSWNYPDSDLDAYLVTTWSSSIKEKVLEKVREHLENETSYIEAAISADVYRMIICGEYKDKDLEKLSVKDLLKEYNFTPNENHHSNEWKDLIDIMTKNSAASINRETIRQYFNITQGEGTSVIVLNEPALNNVIKKIKTNRLAIPESVLETKDPVKPRREVYDYYKSIINRIETVSKSELKIGMSAYEKVQGCFDDEIEEEDILELAEVAKDFYEEVNRSYININNFSVVNIEKNAEKIFKALKVISKSLNESDSLNILMAYSEDPVADVLPLLDLICQLQNDIIKVDNNISKRLDALNEDVYSDSKFNYEQELHAVNECISLIVEGEQ